MRSVVYIRIVPADRDRGFMLLASFIKPVVQKTAFQISSLTAISRKNLDAIIAAIQKSYDPLEIIDTTGAGLQNQLKIIFGETPIKKSKSKSLNQTI